jgi:hypothetical protein
MPGEYYYIVWIGPELTKYGLEKFIDGPYSEKQAYEIVATVEQSEKDMYGEIRVSFSPTKEGAIEEYEMEQMGGTGHSII